MRRSILVVLLLCAPLAHAAISVSAVASCAQSTASTGAACTATTTATDLVIVGLSWRTTTASLKQVTGSGSKTFDIYSQGCNGTGGCSAVVLCLNCAANTTITPTFSATTKYVLNVAQATGVGWVGITNYATGTSTTPGTTTTTGDANDYMVTETASGGTASPTAGTGTLLETNNTGSTGVVGGLISNTSASAGSVTTTNTITSVAWSASSVELRTAAPTTYVYPDCDSTHPCAIYTDNSPGVQVAPDTLTTPIYYPIQPPLANNLLGVYVTHPSAKTISAIGSYDVTGAATGDTWSTGASVTDTTNSLITEIRYVCAASTSDALIKVTLSSTLSGSDQFEMGSFQASGIATSSCSGGTSGTFGVSGNIQPGSITASGTQLLFTLAINSDTGSEPNYTAGWEKPDDASATLIEDNWGNLFSSVRVVDCTSGCNPTITANGLDVQQKHTWTVLSQAFVASSGAGTQPPSGQAWVVRHMQYRSPGTGAFANARIHFPTNGNALVAESSNPQSIRSLVGLADNFGNSFTAVTMTDTTVDPQVYSVCLGSNAANKDRGFYWTDSATAAVPISIYDVAGAKNSGGSQGCIGTKRNHAQCSGTLCFQATTTCGSSPYANSCANIINALGSDGGGFAAALNGSAKSVVITTSYLGTGPPVGPCTATSGGAQGGLTPPSCTGNMSSFVMNSMWASGMSDGQHLYNGDPYGYWYTNSTSGYSIDYMIANFAGTTPTNGGTNYDGAAVEILGQPAATGTGKRLRGYVVNQ